MSRRVIVKSMQRPMVGVERGYLCLGCEVLCLYEEGGREGLAWFRPWRERGTDNILPSNESKHFEFRKGPRAFWVRFAAIRDRYHTHVHSPSTPYHATTGQGLPLPASFSLPPYHNQASSVIKASKHQHFPALAATKPPTPPCPRGGTTRPARHHYRQTATRKMACQGLGAVADA